MKNEKDYSPLSGYIMLVFVLGLILLGTFGLLAAPKPPVYLAIGHLFYSHARIFLYQSQLIYCFGVVW
jgi:hypothetical protein